MDPPRRSARHLGRLARRGKRAGDARGIFDQPQLALGAAFFVQEYRDLVDFDFDLFQSVNRNRVRAKGTELTLRSRLTATLSLDLEATWLQAEAGSDEPLLHRPRWLGGGRLRFEPGTRLSLVLEGRATSSSLDRQIPTPDLDHVSGYAVWGLAGSFRIAIGGRSGRVSTTSPTGCTRPTSASPVRGEGSGSVWRGSARDLIRR